MDTVRFEGNIAKAYTSVYILFQSWEENTQLHVKRHF